MAVNLFDIDIDQIYDFIENGVTENAPKEIVDYLEEMDKVRGMHQRIDQYGSKEAIMNHLIKVDGYSRYLANRLYNQTMEYFHCSTEISKAAWRNIYAELMEKVVSFSIQKMKDTTDASKVGKLILDMAKLRQLDQEDKEDLPMEIYQRPFKMYSVDAEFLGMPSANRKELSAWIDDNLTELPEVMKDRIKSEARILPVKAFVDADKDPRKA